jgi:hypothetical protein
VTGIQVWRSARGSFGEGPAGSSTNEVDGVWRTKPEDEAREAVIAGLLAFIDGNYGSPGTHALADLLHAADIEVTVYGERLEWLSDAVPDALRNPS